MFRKVLVPVDFTRKNRRAVRTAAGVASGRGTTLTLLHVIERVDAGDPRGLAGFYKTLEARARQNLRALLAAASPVPASAEVLYGNRVNEILRFAAEKKI